MKKALISVILGVLMLSGCSNETKWEYETPEELQSVEESVYITDEVVFRGLAMGYDSVRLGESLEMDVTTHPYICNIDYKIERQSGGLQDIITCSFLLHNYDGIDNVIYLYDLEVLGDSIKGISDYVIDGDGGADFTISFDIIVESGGSDVIFRFYNPDIYTEKVYVKGYYIYSPNGDTLMVYENMLGDVEWESYYEYSLTDLMERE